MFMGLSWGALLFAVTLLAASELDEEADRLGRKGPPGVFLYLSS